MLKKLCAVQLSSTPLMSCLSVCTICMLVNAAIIIISIISLTPVIILGIGETQSGSRDLIITPYQRYVNNTKINELTGQISMPRLQTKFIINRDQRATGWFMDFKLQKDNHLGSSLGGDVDNQQGNLIFLNAEFDKQVGQKVNVTLQDNMFFNAIVTHLLTDNTTQNQALISQLTYIMNQVKIQAQFTVTNTFSFGAGKFGQGTVGSYAYININYSLQYMLTSTYKSKQNDSEFRYSLQNSTLLPYVASDKFSLSHYSTQTTINIPNRIQVYSNPDYQQTFEETTAFGLHVMQKLGIFSVKCDMPIADRLTQLSYFGMFIGVTLKLVIISLFLLSVIMMNNMLLVGVQRKSFDFSLMKVLGAKRDFVIVNVLFDSLKYVVVANIIAYPLAYLILIEASSIFQTFFGYSYTITPTVGSLFGGLFIGVFVPIISAIAPIKGIIQNNLIETLNPIRNKTNAFHTEIYIEGRQFPYGKLFFGIIATTFGLMIYYLLPKSLISKDIALLLIIFLSILLGLLIGLIMLSYSFQYILQKIIAYLTLFWTDKTDFTLMLKNLSAHRIKNRRSSILYAISVAFIVFMSVSIDIQIQTIFLQLIKKHGSFVEVTRGVGYIDREYYDSILPHIKGVEDWSYITEDLRNYLPIYGAKKVMVSDKARLFFMNERVMGVSPNYLNTLCSDYYSPVQGPDTTLDPYQYLYTIQGYNSVVLSYYNYKKFKLRNQDGMREFYVNIYYDDRVKRIPLNFSTVLDKKTGLPYSRFMFGVHAVGVSLDTYMSLAGIGSYANIPYWQVNIKLKSLDMAAQVAKQIRKQVDKAQKTDRVWDYTQMKGTIDQINSLLSKIVNILLVLVLTICFFSLITTSYINIINQTNQIGILLTLGYSKTRIVKLYIYEAFVLVLSSCLVGVVVGGFVAWMMSLQRELFGDYPVKLNISGIWIIALAAILSSVLSSLQPAREILKKPINSIMKYS